MKAKFTSISISVFVLSLGFSISAFAQANIDQHNITVIIPPVALLDLETSEASTNFDATFTAPTEAGDKIAVPGANSTLWLNYSSIQTLEVTKRVDVQTNVPVTGGVDVKVLAGSSASGSGTKGTPEAVVTLTTSAQKLIDGIGSAYTETGPSKGHQLTYTFFSTDGTYANIRSGNTTITVKYTLANN